MKIIDLFTGEETEVGDGDLPLIGQPTPFERFIRDARAPEWVVANRIATRSVTVIAGPAKRARKTIHVITMALAVSRGQPWLGQPTQAREVHFCGFEGGREFLAYRTIEAGYQQDPLAANAFFADGIDGWRWIHARLVRDAKRGDQWPCLIVVDTLSHVLAHEGVDENDNQAITLYLGRIDRLAQITGCAIVVVHHFAKYAPRMRGAGAMEALCNWCEVHPEPDQPEVSRLEWVLRQGPGVTTWCRVSKPNGTFLCEVLSGRPQTRKPSNSRASAIRNTLEGLLRARVGQNIPVDEIVQEVNTAISDRWKEPVRSGKIKDLADGMAEKGPWTGRVHTQYFEDAGWCVVVDSVPAGTPDGTEEVNY